MNSSNRYINQDSANKAGSQVELSRSTFVDHSNPVTQEDLLEKRLSALSQSRPTAPDAIEVVDQSRNTAQNSNKRKKQQSRQAKNSGSVQAALRDLNSQIAGALDARRATSNDNKDRQALYQKKKDGPRLRKLGQGWCVNYWALQNSKTTTDFDFVLAESLCHIRGKFFFEKDPVIIITTLPLYDGIAEVNCASDDGVLLHVTNLSGTADIELLDCVVVNNDMRLKNALSTVMYRLNPFKPLDTIVVVTNARAAYRRHYKVYPRLESDLLNLYHSPWFYGEYGKVIDKIAKTWVQATEARLQHVLVNRGSTLTEELRKYLPKVRSGLIVYYLKYIPYPIFHLVNKLKRKAYYDENTTWEQSWEDWFDLKHRDKLHKLIQQEFPSIPVGLVPCATAYLEKCHTAVDLPEPIIDIEHGEFYSADIVDCLDEKTVDVFGMAVSSGLAYPASDNYNLDAALRIRMLQNENYGNPDFAAFARNKIDQLPPIELVGIDQYTHLRSVYPEKKALRLMELSKHPLDERDLMSELFVKGEVYVGKSPDNMKPRMIWNRSEKVVAKFSHVFKELGDKLPRAWNSMNPNILYTSKSKPDDVGSFASSFFEQNLNVYESDVSNWDGSLTTDMLRLERYLLRTKVAGLPSEFDYLLDNWLKVSGTSKDGAIKVNITHGRRSGDLWTSLFNSLLNILITMWVNNCGWNAYSMLVLGDDNVVALDKPINAKYLEFKYHQLGMKCTVVVRDTITDLTYCSGMFIRVNGIYRWSNLLGKLVAKLGINHHNHSPSEYRALLYGVCKSLLPTVGHVPVMGALCRAICDTAQSIGISPRFDNRHLNPYRIQGGIACYPDMESYIDFHQRYGVDPLSAMKLEESIMKIVHIANCPYSVEGLLRNITDIDLNTSIESMTRTLMGDTQYEYVVNKAPRIEEKLKLQGATFHECLVNAIKMGEHENRVAKVNSHVTLHVLFTTLSYINFEWGVWVHSEYNRIAMNRMLPPCAKNNNKKSNQRRKNKNVKTLTNRMNGFSPYGYSQPGNIGRINGQGGYFTDALRAGGRTAKRLTPNGAFRAIGGAMGGALGGPTGALAGSLLGQSIATVAGFGDYVMGPSSIRANSLMAPLDEGVQIPAFDSGPHTTVIEHREYITDVLATGGTTFTIYNFWLNPGLIATFPWLSGVLQYYSAYQFLGLVFEYRSTASDITAGGALGSVIMATDYTLGSNFTNKVYMENSQYSTSCKPSLSMFHSVECDPSIINNPIKFVRSAGVPSGEDSRLYDWGNFQLATTQLPISSGAIGELWVTYRVVAYRPSLEMAISCHYDHFSLPQTIATTHYLGADTTTNLTADVTSTIGGTAVNSTYSFPPGLGSGKFYVQYTVIGAASTITNAMSQTLTNCSAYALFGNGTGCTPNSGGAAPQSGALACTTTEFLRAVTITAPGATIAFTTGTLPGTISAGDLWVFRISS